MAATDNNITRDNLLSFFNHLKRCQNHRVFTYFDVCFSQIKPFPFVTSPLFICLVDSPFTNQVICIHRTQLISIHPNLIQQLLICTRVPRIMTLNIFCFSTSLGLTSFFFQCPASSNCGIYMSNDREVLELQFFLIVLTNLHWLLLVSP